jgi:hypothetical protein
MLLGVLEVYYRREDGEKWGGREQIRRGVGRVGRKGWIAHKVHTNHTAYCFWVYQ